MAKQLWYKSNVHKGHKIGRTIGFPTINLDPKLLPDDQPEGVYASLVRYNGRRYTGALYLGPRQVFGETKQVLEIHLLGFNKRVYGEEVSFSLIKQIRGLVDLPSVKALEVQMAADIEQIKSVVDEFKQATHRR